MDINIALKNVEVDELRNKIEAFLLTITSPAFGALPKREMEVCVFDLMRSLGILNPNATIYNLMTDLRITRAKASQLIFDYEIRQRGNDIATLDNLIKEALINTRFAKDGDFFVMEIENPLVLAHMRQKIRDVGHISDTSFNSSLVRAPLDAVTDLMLNIIPDTEHDTIQTALIEAGAPEGGLKAVIKGALKALGRRVVGEAADGIADSVVDSSANFIRPIFTAGTEEIRRNWGNIFSQIHSNK